MVGKSHEEVTRKVFELLRDIDPAHPLLRWQESVIDEAGQVDNYTDLEFIDVEGVWRTGRDDPHSTEWNADDDEPHYKLKDYSFAAWNHFIDIKKGSGLFDDYDGYSYRKGSASSQEYETLGDYGNFYTELPVAEGLALAFPIISNIAAEEKVDHALNGYWLNDEYVHAPGHEYYQNCSPALPRYSFPRDKGIYNDKEAELMARFPLAEHVGGSGRGIPYSVFMPVDNLARCWYWLFLKFRSVRALGPVMHAIQDASVPHHAAGYFGNYHGRYEDDLKKFIRNWFNSSASLKQDVRAYYTKWDRLDDSPPTHLKVSEWTRVPAINWSIDQLVTWVALNAYKEYDEAYNNFREGYHFHQNSAKVLTTIAIAMSLLVLRKTQQVGLTEALHHAGKKLPTSICKAFPSNAKSLRERIDIAKDDLLYTDPLPYPVHIG